MRAFTEKPRASRQTTPVKSTITGRAHFGPRSEADSIVRLPRPMGDQAVQRSLRTNAEEHQDGTHTDVAPRFFHDFSRIPLYPNARTTIQPKLTISTPGDVYEQEADRVTDRVMGMTESTLARASVGPWGGAGLKSQVQAERSSQAEDSPETKRVEQNDAETTPVLPIVDQASGSPGQPLDTETRTFMERRFGHDFGSVRVHAGRSAAASARALRACAYTLGQHIVFDEGRYAPGTTAGRRLIAHELTHVVQQGPSGPTIMREINCNLFAGGRPPSPEESRILMEDFPRLRLGDFCITGEPNSSYNCYAFSVGITDQFITETYIDTFHGDRDGTFTFRDMNDFYAAYGLVPTDSGGEVVVLGRDRTPQHAAKKTRMMSRGVPIFESKLGQDERIVHFPDQLEGGEYGNIQRRYTRGRPLRLTRVPHTAIPYELEPEQP